MRRDALEEPLDEVLSSIGLGDKKKESTRVVVTAPYAYVDVEKEEVKEEEEEEEEKVKEEKKDVTVPALPTPTIVKATIETTPKLDTKEQVFKDDDDASPTASQKWARNTLEDLRDRVYRKYGQLQRAFLHSVFLNSVFLSRAFLNSFGLN